MCKNRDEMRNLSILDQRNLQEDAAKRIAQMKENIVIIDTHLFIRTSEWSLSWRAHECN